MKHNVKKWAAFLCVTTAIASLLCGCGQQQQEQETFIGLS